jgi:predicted RNA methylase
MFDGSKPVFIDLLSFEPMNSTDGLWRPYAQFVRTFLYPLLASRACGLGLDEVFVTHRDGLEPERMARMTPGWRLLTPPFFGLVTLPALLPHGGGYQLRQCRDRDEANFLYGRVFARARRKLDQVAGSQRRRSAVARYMETEQSYTAAEFQTKESFVAGVLGKHRPRRVLDAGCNTGHFSLLAAKHGASVVAIDRDVSSVGLLWQRSNETGADVLPLVVDLARPSPAIGWANAEAPSFLARAEGEFDCVLMLALLHHLVVSERIPLDCVFELAAGLTTDLLVLEYVDPSDLQFRRIARGREALHRDLTSAAFESAAAGRFEVLEHCDVSPTRRVYILKKKGF